MQTVLFLENKQKSMPIRLAVVLYSISVSFE